MPADALSLEDLFPLFGGLPLLTDAERADPGTAISRRTADEVHPCVFCPEQAWVALVAGPSDLIGRPQWVDLCAAHNHGLLLLADDLQREFVNDAQIIRRFEDWHRGRQLTAGA